jgi:hypothetical protein
MLIETDSKTYYKYFPVNPHQYISEPFIELNKGKAERIVRLIDIIDTGKIGLIAGIRNGLLKSPFSAPFGGFHFRNENIYISELDNFIASLKAYVIFQKLKGIELILPPDLYHLTFNTKTVNSLIRNGFQPQTPDITCWVNLQLFHGVFTQKSSNKFYRQAVRNGLSFEITYDEGDETEIYNLICQNRARFGRPIYMTFKDLKDTNNIWPVDFFKVCTIDRTIVASAIFYRSHPEICYGVFWGDNEVGRQYRAMDYLVFNLFSYYKNLQFKYMDLGTSTEAGRPNVGLLRFKENHESISSLRFKFLWYLKE